MLTSVKNKLKNLFNVNSRFSNPVEERSLGSINEPQVKQRYDRSHSCWVTDLVVVYKKVQCSTVTQSLGGWLHEHCPEVGPHPNR